jgi:hypothetical protein
MTFLLAGLIVAILAIGVYASVRFQPSGTSESSTLPTTSTLQTTETTSVNSTSCSSSTTHTSTTSTLSTSNSSSSSGISATSFTYSPHTPVKVTSVQAMVSQLQGGDRKVTFSVGFVNIGNFQIYIIGGCGSSLNSTIAANPSVIQRVSGGPVCLCAEFVMPLNQGANDTLTNPGCWSGYSYTLIGSGTVNVNFTLQWGTSSGQYFQNSTSIEATFTF